MKNAAMDVAAFFIMLSLSFVLNIERFDTHVM